MRGLLQYIKEIGFEDIINIEDVQSCSGRVKRVQRKDGKDYYLKEKESKELAQREYELMAYLAKRGIPVAVPITTNLGEPYILFKDKLYFLYPRLKGEPVKNHFWDNYLVRARLLGEAVANLHIALRDYNNLKAYHDSNLADGIIDYIIPEISKKGDKFDIDLIETIKEGFVKEFSPSFDRLPKHLIHRDIHPENMLTDGEKITGYIDFDLALKSVRLFDPCYCATSILVGGIDDGGKREKWPEILTQILEGYKKIGLLEVERHNIMYILYAIQLIFMKFGLSINDVNSAKCNERVLRWLYANRTSIMLRLKGINLT